MPNNGFSKLNRPYNGILQQIMLNNAILQYFRPNNGISQPNIPSQQIHFLMAAQNSQVGPGSHFAESECPCG